MPQILLPTGINSASLPDDHVVIIYVLQVIAIPGGYRLLLTAYKQILVSKRLEVSQTAIEIINGRWTMHVCAQR